MVDVAEVQRVTSLCGVGLKKVAKGMSVLVSDIVSVFVCSREEHPGQRLRLSDLLERLDFEVLEVHVRVS